MKLLALHDSTGRIVAAVRHRPDYRGPVPVAGEGTHLVTIDVPSAHAQLDLHTLCMRFRVDPRTSQLIEHKAASQA